MYYIIIYNVKKRLLLNNNYCFKSKLIKNKHEHKVYTPKKLGFCLLTYNNCIIKKYSFLKISYLKIILFIKFKLLYCFV